MVYIPNQWIEYWKKSVDRGWVDPYTLKPIPDQKNISEIPSLPIDNESLTRLRDLLLDLGIKDNNIIITKLYFELARRSNSVSFYEPDVARTLYDRGIQMENATEDDWNSVSEPLPIKEKDFIDIASLLGKLAIKDKGEIDKSYRMIIPYSFLYLLDRARNGNKFSISEEINGLENTIFLMFEETDSDKLEKEEFNKMKL